MSLGWRRAHQLRKTGWLGLGPGLTKHSPQLLTEQRNPPSWHWLGAHKLNSMCKIPSQDFLEATAALVTAGPPLCAYPPFFCFFFLFFQTRDLSGQRIWAAALEGGRSLWLPSSYGVSLFEDHPKNAGGLHSIHPQPERIKFIPALRWTMQGRIVSPHHRDFDIYLVRRKRIEALF